MLTSEQVRFFADQGYLAVRQAIDAGSLARLRAATDALMDESRRFNGTNDLFDLEPDHSPARPRLRRIKHPVAAAPAFREVGFGAAVLDCVESLIGPHIRFHHSKLNFKAGDGGAGVGWHQDFAFFPHTNYDLVACGIALDDCTLENGCLLVVPGSHRRPLLDHRSASGEFLGQINEQAHPIDERAAVPVELRAGDMSIHHACVVHGSAPNRSSGPRRLLIFQFAACDAIPLEPQPADNLYSGSVVRGQPSRYARLAEAVSLPLRGEPSGRSIFEVQQAVRG